MRSLLPLFLLIILPAYANAGIEVQNVAFSQLRSGSIMMAVELRAKRDSATREKFYSDIRVGAYASWGKEGKADPAALTFYRSAAEIVAIEVNQSVVVPFILSGGAVQLDELRRDPFAYYVEVTVGEEPIPFSDSMVSSSIRGNPAAIRSIKDRADGQDGQENDGLFVPFYLSPYGLENASVRNLPFFKRPELKLLFE